MMFRQAICAVAVWAVSANVGFAQETLAKSKITQVSLFKNGLAIVKREVEITQPGIYQLDVMPDAVHGTFWIESTATSVEAAVRMRDVEVSGDLVPEGGYQEIFSGKKVTVHFKDGKIPSVTGTALKPFKAKPGEASARKPAATRFFILKTDKGQIYINPPEIAAIEAQDGNAQTTERKAVLTLTVGAWPEKNKDKQTVFISYLSQGLAWAPSYRVDIADNKTLAVEMAAVLRNEMADFDGAEVTLISGYPSVEFANVASPLLAQTGWTKFFQDVSRRSAREIDIASQSIMSNSAITNYKVPLATRLDLSATPTGEGVDLHFQPVGKRSLLQGEGLSFTVDKSKVAYERIVEWTLGSKEGTGSSRDSSKDEMWDVLLFKNPFQFPLTTGPAMIVDGGKFNGQRTAYWTNVGEETNLKVTKSLSVRTLSKEEEDKTTQPVRVAVDERTYTRLVLKGELAANNHRKEAVKLRILYNIRGEFVSADGSPTVTAREGTLTTLNPSRELAWEVTLQPGEEKKLNYRYSTLVNR